jgi:hypothetical protein
MHPGAQRTFVVRACGGGRASVLLSRGFSVAQALLD